MDVFFLFCFVLFLFLFLYCDCVTKTSGGLAVCQHEPVVNPIQTGGGGGGGGFSNPSSGKIVLTATPKEL